jgi:dihydrofolate reductase
VLGEIEDDDVVERLTCHWNAPWAAESRPGAMLRRAAVKCKDGRGAAAAGSSMLVHTLAEHDLVDEYSLWVYPVVLGAGKKLFPDSRRLNLRLIESKALPTGVVLMRYERASE